MNQYIPVEIKALHVFNLTLLSDRCCLFAAGGSDLSLLRMSALSLGPTQLPIQRPQRGSFLWLKRPGLEADGSLSFSDEVKDDGATPPLLPYVFMASCLMN
jgi:hypothetical protein